MIPDIGAPTPPRILIALPSHSHVPVTFAYDLAQLTAFTVATLPEGVEVGTALVEGTYIHRARQDLMEHALAAGVTHILWLDTDMRFPKEALVWLLGKRKDFVGINYCTRGLPPGYVAIKRGGWKSGEDLGEKLVTSEDSEGLEEVDALGFGVTLMRVDAFRGLPEGEPWFWYEMVHGGRHIGEDVYFCRLAQEDLGLSIWVDHDLSKLCGHTGTFDFELSHAELWAGGE